MDLYDWANIVDLRLAVQLLSFLPALFTIFFSPIPFFTLSFYDYYWRWIHTWAALGSHWGLNRGQAVHTVVWLPPLAIIPFLCNLKTKQISSLKSAQTKSTICWLMNFMNWMMMNIWNTPHWMNVRCCLTNLVLCQKVSSLGCACDV